MSVQEIQAMPRAEKLKLMEALWVELTRDEAEFESPAWHEAALKETAQRFAEGCEEVLDWEQAKAELRRLKS
jgi:hypothetical protein